MLDGNAAAPRMNLQLAAFDSLEPNGVVTIAHGDVRLVKPREPALEDGRRAVMLRPDLERYAAWEHAARDRPVSVWLAKLADIAAGVR